MKSAACFNGVSAVSIRQFQHGQTHVIRTAVRRGQVNRPSKSFNCLQDFLVHLPFCEDKMKPAGRREGLVPRDPMRSQTLERRRLTTCWCRSRENHPVQRAVPTPEPQGRQHRIQDEFRIRQTSGPLHGNCNHVRERKHRHVSQRRSGAGQAHVRRLSFTAKE